ncbi:hypothetical protein M0Q28_06095 [Patescibacteria group bacterium]|jgi:hypothetical protein|nr:hypothetical protein [Patescibacteria group bacterium]
MGDTAELKPVAWRVKDYADGWIIYTDEKRARIESVVMSGALVEPLYSADALSSLVRERDEARELVTEANNSLYGSQGYFHSLNGGPFDKYHLATGIEKLKSGANRQYHAFEAAEARATAAEAERDEEREALEELEAASDALAATRSQQTYLSMIDNDRATDALNRLDVARKRARNALGGKDE